MHLETFIHNIHLRSLFQIKLFQNTVHHQSIASRMILNVIDEFLTLYFSKLAETRKILSNFLINSCYESGIFSLTAQSLSYCRPIYWFTYYCGSIYSNLRF
jgi:hypothetical protein